MGTDLAVPAELDQVRVRVNSEKEQRRFEKTYDLGPGRTILPFTLALVPDQDRAIGFQVVVSGFAGGNLVVERSTTTSFVGDETLVLYMDLLRLCRLLAPDAAQVLTLFGRYDYADTQAVVPAGFAARPELRRDTATAGVVYRPIPQIGLKLDARRHWLGDGTAFGELAAAVTWMF